MNMYSPTGSGLWAPTAQFQPTEKNVLVVYNPQPNMKISQQALRSHQYNIDDRLVNDLAGVSASNAVGGASSRLDQVLSSKHAQNAITLGTDADALFDVNSFNNMWRFVLTLNRFPQSYGLNKYTVIITGVFRDEPFNPLTKTINPTSMMEVHSRQVISRSSAMGPNGITNNSTNTVGDQLFYNPKDAHTSNLWGSNLSKNTPGAFDLSNMQLTDSTGVPIFTTPAMYGNKEASMFSNASTSLNRFNHLPRTIIRNMAEAVSNDVSKSEANRFGQTLGAFDLGDADFSENHLTQISQYLRQREDTLHIPMGLGPAQNDLVSVADLQSKWMVDELIPVDLQDGTSFMGEDQTVRSQRSVYCSLISTLLPTFCSNLQVSDAQCRIWVQQIGYGQYDIVANWDYLHLSVVGLNTEEEKRRASVLLTELKGAVLENMMETVGDFSLYIDFHMYGKSHLSLQFAAEGNTAGNVWEFMPNHTTFTTPLMAGENRIQDNQQNFGQMIYEVSKRANGQGMMTSGSFLDTGDSFPAASSYDSIHPFSGLVDQNSNPIQSDQGFNPFGGMGISDTSGAVHDPGNHGPAGPGGFFNPK